MDDDGNILPVISKVDVSESRRSLREAIAPRYTGALYEVNKHHVGEFSEKEVDPFSDFLGKLLRYEPAERISAREALEHDWFGFSEDGN